MALMNSLQAGVSGLRAFETKMDVIGNNIANVGTAGFKGGRVTFSELLNQNIRRDQVRFNSAPRIDNQVGLGVRVSSIDRNFEQGALESTNVATDLAIDGNGWFVVRDGGTQLATRAGAFRFNANGDLVTATGLSVQGFNSDVNGNIITGGATSDIRVNFDDVFRPQQTSEVDVVGNLNSNTSTRQVISAGSSLTTNVGSPAQITTDLANLDQMLNSLADGDVFRFSGTANGSIDPITGEPVDQNFTLDFVYGAGNDGTTLGDLLNAVQAAYTNNTDSSLKGPAVALEDGQIVVRDNNLGVSRLAVGSLDLLDTKDVSNFATSTIGDATTAQVVTGQVGFRTSSGVATGATDLVNTLQYSGITNGDTIIVSGRNGDGSNYSRTFTYGAGNDGTTLNDLLTVVNGGLTDSTAAINGNGQLELTAAATGVSSLSVTNFGEGLSTAPIRSVSFDSTNFQETVSGAINSETISSTIWDSQGEAHTFVVELTQTDFNTWSYESRFLNGENITSGGKGTLRFDADGNFVTILDENGNGVDNISISFDPGNGAGDQSFNVGLKGATGTGRITQFDGSSTVNVSRQNGFAKGELLDVFIDSSGNIVGSYSNGQTKELSKIALANVPNEQGLNHLGDGLFSSNRQSGSFVIETVDALDGTTLSAGFLEGSNVDLAEQFTEMIITQRAYQSNARVITTADQLLGEAVQLKR